LHVLHDDGAVQMILPLAEIPSNHAPNRPEAIEHPDNTFLIDLAFATAPTSA
jgi:hypothetical protein